MHVSTHHPPLRWTPSVASWICRKHCTPSSRPHWYCQPGRWYKGHKRRQIKHTHPRPRTWRGEWLHEGRLGTEWETLRHLSFGHSEGHRWSGRAKWAVFPYLLHRDNIFKNMFILAAAVHVTSPFLNSSSQVSTDVFALLLWCIIHSDSVSMLSWDRDSLSNFSVNVWIE